jgi:acyl carrier protein
VSDDTHYSDEQLVLRDIRALLDQLQLDRDGALTMESQLTDDLGVDSLALVELCDQLERTFDVTLPDEVFLSATTPRQWLIAVLKARGDASQVHPLDETHVESPPVNRSRDERARARLERLITITRDAWHSRATRDSSDASTNASSNAPSSVLYAFYAWVLLVPFALALWLLAVLPLPLPQRRNAGRAIARFTCRVLGLSVSVEGALPSSERPSVITANHSSFIDGLILYVFLNEPLTFVSSTDMEQQFLLGRIMRGFGCVFVDRGRAERSAASVEKLVGAIQRGHHVLIFPEGSLSARPGLRVFHLGAFEAAASSNCPVVPIGIRGSRDILRPGRFRPHPGAVHVSIGEPITPVGSGFSERVVIRDQVRSAIARLCGETES